MKRINSVRCTDIYLDCVVYNLEYNIISVKRSVQKLRVIQVLRKQRKYVLTKFRALVLFFHYTLVLKYMITNILNYWVILKFYKYYLYSMLLI